MKLDCPLIKILYKLLSNYNILIFSQETNQWKSRAQPKDLLKMFMKTLKISQ